MDIDEALWHGALNEEQSQELRDRIRRAHYVLEHMLIETREAKKLAPPGKHRLDLMIPLKEGHKARMILEGKPIE